MVLRRNAKSWVEYDKRMLGMQTPTNRSPWRCSSLYEAQPKQELVQLNLLRLGPIDDDHVETVCVSNQVVIDNIVRLIARKLPEAYNIRI